MSTYTVSLERADANGTLWFDVQADNTLAAISIAADLFEDEVGTTDAHTTVEAHLVSVPVALSEGEVVHCGNCLKPLAKGFIVCSKECADEVNEGLVGDDRVQRFDYPSKDGTWRVAWRSSERGYRVVWLGRNLLARHGEEPYDEQRPLAYDELLYPDEAPARARAEALNAA